MLSSAYADIHCRLFVQFFPECIPLTSIMVSRLRDYAIDWVGGEWSWKSS